MLTIPRHLILKVTPLATGFDRVELFFGDQAAKPVCRPVGKLGRSVFPNQVIRRAGETAPQTAGIRSISSSVISPWLRS